ncbi:MAG: GTPase HflX [Crenarchaeota archaeon]|nr:MAG: GTPase HflX [Thermoproteota archaeon]RDJ34627.1 MAG: GTPase HflX [Thermoproteota archaeon]RDJ34706.1 MAG: GTPase HflX [Thermoproteota archaeon]RDJ38429.1 MAG: GTPase HflX [Thermoproteota archaeon]
MQSAILITYDKDDIKNEAVALCDSAGYQILHIIQQKFLQRQKYGISEEIVERLDTIAQKLNPDVIVFDEVLKPSQNYNLASKLRRNILDRETLILEIFERRASSSESHLQVKLAQMRYEMSRAKEKVRLAKIGEQPGFMGIGQYEVETYHNDIKHRMQTVKSKLEKAGKQRELHRVSRKRQGFKTISLAGYTSAGKTTLFNALTGETKEQSSELFTTLSTTIRRVTIDQVPFLISDTVGFISKLPAYMIEAFRSTLEELLFTDVVVVVIDISDSGVNLRKKFASCHKTLSELGVQPDRIIFAMNKADLVDMSEINEKIKSIGLEESKKWIPVSAKSGENIQKLKELIKEVLDGQQTPTIIKNPYKEELEKFYDNRSS